MRYFNRNILFSLPNGDKSNYIPPCGSFQYHFTVPERDFPVEHVIRFAGEPDYFWKWRCEHGSPYSISQCIDDALDPRDTYKEPLALHFECKNEPYDRECWIKLKHDTFAAGRNYTFSLPFKSCELEYAENGTVLAELEIYYSKNGRHPDDVFDEPDEIKTLVLPEGSSGWNTLSQEFAMPENAVCIIVHILLRHVSGGIYLGSPRLAADGEDNIIPPLDRQQHRDSSMCYTAAHMSRREWLEFECLIDGSKIFDGEMYSSIFRRPDFELPAGKLSAGDHTITFNFKNDYPDAVGFIMSQLELLEYSSRSFELIYAPAFVRKPEQQKLLVKTCHPDVKLSVNGKEHVIHTPGLNVLEFSLSEGNTTTVTLDSGDHRDQAVITNMTDFEDSEYIHISTGDAIFIRQTPAEMLRYLEWYLGSNIGNTVCFRHSYRWGGGRAMDPEIWKTVIPLLNELGISYFLMIDGRELPGRNFNPPDDLLAGPGYLGRQSHENDGSFYYWNNTLWKKEPLPEPLADILSRSVDKGGIQPHVRPKRQDGEAWWFFNPADCRNMKEAAEAFVSNLKDAKGDSTRHSGPSALFRYFFQAGYDFLLAEQMYGPEEVILSALRGASKAYGRNGFGAHLAVQWSSTPHDTQEHAERYFLSLAACYMQGVTQINTEEGLYRMEKDFVDFDRFSSTCQRHRKAHEHFRSFAESHPRRGKLITPIACIQGRYDGWSCFTRPETVWNRTGQQWKFGPAEESFDLLNVFFPRSRFTDIYCCPCSNEPHGWYTGTPYGPVDLLPFEGDWSSSKCVIFLGWHSFVPDDAKKMLDYVRRGGTLLLSRRHLSTALEHDAAPEYVNTPELDILLGDSWQTAEGIIRRTVGSGKLIFFACDTFPAETAIRKEYEKAMADIAQDICSREYEKCYVKANEDVNFCVRELDDGSFQLMLLNIRWWDKAPSHVTVYRNNIPYEQEVEYGKIVFSQFEA